MRALSTILSPNLLIAAALVACALAIAPHAGATHRPEVTISVETDKLVYRLGDDFLTAHVRITNTGPIISNVDAHVLIAPASLEQIYEWPDWNTSLQPGLTSLTVPENLSLPETRLLNLELRQEVPWLDTLREGGTQLYFLGVVLTREGTTEFISNLALAPFYVTDGDVPSDVNFGIVGLSETENLVSDTPGTDRVAFGTFTEGFQFLNPDQCGNDASFSRFARDTCRVTQCTTSELLSDFTDPQADTPFGSTLDAGSRLAADIFHDRSDPVANRSIVIPRDAEALDLVGASVYVRDDLPRSDYVGNAYYLFKGFGGPDVGQFAFPLRAPSRLTGVALNNNSNLASGPTIQRGNGLQVKWDPGLVHHDVWVTITTSEISFSTFQTTFYELSCRFRDDGLQTIPGDVLNELPATQSLADLFPSIDTSQIEQLLGEDIFGLSGTEISVRRADWGIFPVPGVEYTLGWIENGVRAPLVLQ